MLDKIQVSLYIHVTTYYMGICISNPGHYGKLDLYFPPLSLAFGVPHYIKAIEGSHVTRHLTRVHQLVIMVVTG